MKNKIKALEMMGYEVVVSEITDDILVTFRTKGGYLCYYNMYVHEMEKDFAVERIVKSINEMLYLEI